MSKCKHNQQIRYFCIKQLCNYPEISGCSKCFSEQHIHLQSKESDTIDIDQVRQLLLKYSFHDKFKPECVPLRQSFQTFFKIAKNQLKEIDNIIDQVCKNVVNNIGYPYICYKNYFNLFKKIENKEYNQLPADEFRKFISEAKNTPINKLTQLQQKLYLKQVNKSHEMIKQINYMISQFSNVLKYYNNKIIFIHDNSQYLKNKQIVQKIKLQLKNHYQKHQDRNKNITTLFQPNQSISNTVLHGQANTIMCLSSHHQNNGTKNNSTNGFNFIQPVSMFSQKSQLQKSYEKQKQQQIKQNLIQFIGKKQKQKEIKNGNISKNTSSIKVKRAQSIDSHLAKSSKLQEKVKKVRLQNKQKQGGKTEQSGDNKNSKNTIKNNNLPIDEDKPKLFEKSQQKQIQIIPILRKLKDKLYQNQLDVIQSPLIKNIFKFKKLKIDQIKTQKIRKISLDDKFIQIPNLSEQSFSRKNSKQFYRRAQRSKSLIFQLNECQQQSLGYLLNSLKLKPALAIPIIQNALQSSNKNLSAAQYLSYLYLQSNQYKKCIALCTRYLSLMNNNKDLAQQIMFFLNNKASALNNLGRYSETVKLMENCPLINEITLKNLGNANLGLGYFDQAISLYKQLLLQINDDEVLYNLSACHYLTNNYQSAKQSIFLALSQQPHKKQYLQLKNHILSSIKRTCS